MDIFIAWRNLWRNPRRTAIILTAIIIGIGSMVVLSALMRGMIGGMVDNAIKNLVGHIRIQDPQYRIDPSITNRIDDPHTIISLIEPLLPSGSRVTERIIVDGMLSTSREHIGVMLVGIIPEKERDISFIGTPVHRGRMFTIEEPSGLVVGEALLERIGAKIGQKVVLMSQTSNYENASSAFRIRGTYHTELAQTEKMYVFAPLPAVQAMVGVGTGVTEISINLSQDAGQQDVSLGRLVSDINDKISNRGYQTTDWHQMLPAISAYLEMFDSYMLIWFVVVFIAMGFGLVNTMLMAVYERMREFGLQRALGMRSGRIIKMVMIETLLLLGIGSLVANFCALFLIKVVLHSGIDLTIFAEGAEMWGIDRVVVPVVSSWDVYGANIIVLVLGLFVGLYPAVRAARFTPIETMRHL